MPKTYGRLHASKAEGTQAEAEQNDPASRVYCHAQHDRYEVLKRPAELEKTVPSPTCFPCSFQVLQMRDEIKNGRRSCRDPLRDCSIATVAGRLIRSTTFSGAKLPTRRQKLISPSLPPLSRQSQRSTQRRKAPYKTEDRKADRFDMCPLTFQSLLVSG